MPLFCKQCNGRRAPVFQKDENTSHWLCETCKNYTNENDEILREQTQEERDQLKKQSVDFDNSLTFTEEKLHRRKGVN